MLQALHLWFPPAAPLLALTLSYPLWSWRRLEHAMRFLNRELAVLNSEQASEPETAAAEPAVAFEFLQRVLPIGGWSTHMRDGRLLHQDGEHVPHPPQELAQGRWVHNDDTLWFNTGNADGPAIVGIRWTAEAPPNAEQQHLLNDLAQRYSGETLAQPRSTIEVVEARIQQVQRATSRMRALRKFVADTVSQMADGIVVVNTLGDIVLANQHAALYLLDDSKAQLSGQSLLDTFEMLEVQGVSPWASLLRSVLVENKQVQIEAHHRSGRDLLVQFAPLSQPGGELAGLIINLADISPLKDSERKRAELLGFLSHDLRSPLVSLLALLEISKTKSMTPELSTLLDRMEGYTTNTLALAEQFLQLAHAESGENVVYQETDLVNVALNALEQVWAQAESKQIALQHSFSVEDAWIVADAGLLERALVNLLTNAIKYSPASTSVTLTVSKAEDLYSCCVADQGPGIDAQDQLHLFDRFQRLRQADQSAQRGAGLGLTFVKVVTEQHGGRIELTSDVGKGSRFCLILPAQGAAI
jgi:signal transduction histidine kinase